MSPECEAFKDWVNDAMASVIFYDFELGMTLVNDVMEIASNGEGMESLEAIHKRVLNALQLVRMGHEARLADLQKNN